LKLACFNMSSMPILFPSTNPLESTKTEDGNVLALTSRHF
jgi:hypothetical protein